MSEWDIPSILTNLYNDLKSEAKNVIKNNSSINSIISESAKMFNHVVSSSDVYDIPISETCMDIALSNPSSVNTKDYKTVKNSRIKEIVGDKTYNKFVKKHSDSFNNPYPTVEFSANSELAKALNNSSNLKSLAKQFAQLPADKKPIMGFGVLTRENDSMDLYASIHQYKIINPKIENGYFTGYIYDTYDFETMQPDGSKLTEFNNYTVKLQNAGVIKNYNILVPIKIKL